MSKSNEEKVQQQLKRSRAKLKRSLPHDPDGMNDERAQHARTVVAAYRGITGLKRKDAVSELMTALHHLADRDNRLRSFDSSLDRAQIRYEEQTAEPFCD